MTRVWRVTLSAAASLLAAALIFVGPLLLTPHAPSPLWPAKHPLIKDQSRAPHTDGKQVTYWDWDEPWGDR